MHFDLHSFNVYPPQIRSMLTYLEGARFKLQSALLELDHKPRGSHPLAPHIQITRDRTGLQQSILKVPLWLKNGEEDRSTCDSDEADVGGEATTNDDQSDTYADSKNEILIKHFDRNFSRSTSNVDYANNKIEIIHGIGSSSTGNTNSDNSGSPVFDRGIADGNSNQHDSDFGESRHCGWGWREELTELIFCLPIVLFQTNFHRKMRTTR